MLSVTVCHKDNIKVYKMDGKRKIEIIGPLKLERDGEERMHSGREFQSLMTEGRKEFSVQKGGGGLRVR